MWIVFVTTFTVLLVGALWLAGWFFSISLWVKIGLTLLVVGVVLLSVVLVYVLRLQKSQNLERDLVKDEKAAADADPAQRQQILALQQQVQKAIAALKQSRLGARGGATALYALPWYVIVGPPGAGKTTAIIHSGLSFPLNQGAAYRGTSGTKNCDWWFTNDAILLDTAGRYSMGDAVKNQPEWLRFLDLLRKYRPRKPINGLIVALSILDISNADDKKIDAFAKQLRARIDEVITRLKVLVPVYVIFTKTDLVAGFSEFWDDLRKSERHQIWGATIPLRSTLEPQEAFEQEFDSLIQALHGRALQRLAGERNQALHHHIIRFPVDFGALKNKLGAFLAALFERNSFQETPHMRGFYFTSGLQTVRPMSRVLEAMSIALKIKPDPKTTDQAQVPVPPDHSQVPVPPGHPEAQVQAPLVESKSYFLTDVFFKNVFPDQHIAGRTAAERRRQLLLHLAVAAVAITTAACLLLPAAITFYRNLNLVKTTAALGMELESSQWDDEAKIQASKTALTGAEARLRQLDGWREGHPPMQLRWGLYTGNSLYPSLRAAYVATVDRAILNDVHASLADRLHAFDPAPSRSMDHFNRDFDQLKLYLMLSDPQHMDPTWATPRLVRQRDLTSRPRVPDPASLFGPHVLYVSQLLQRNEVKPWKADDPLITHSRTLLEQVPQLERLYETLVRDATTEIAPIRRETIFYGSVAPFVRSRNGLQVDGAYTKQGWMRIKSLLSTEKAKLIKERWVLGEDETQITQSIGKLREVYFERFKNAWRDFILDLEVSDPGNSSYALAQLNALAEPEWPYLRLINIINDNVTLDVDEPEDDKSLLDKAKEKASDNVKEFVDAGASPSKKKAISPVERAFKPILRFGVPLDVKEGGAPPATGLAQWEALVAKVIGALIDLRDGETTSDSNKRMNDVFQEAFRSTDALLTEQDSFTRPLISSLLMLPLRLAYSNVVKDAGGAAGAGWEVTVWPKWHEKLEGRYPFVATSRTDAPLEDFLHFFGRGDGILWSYYDDSLKATLDRTGNMFVPSRRFKSSIGYRADFLGVCLKRGADITDALFAPKADHASVEFDVNLHSVSPTISQVTFEVDGTEHVYKNEPEEWIHMQWPGKGQHQARLRVRGSGGLDEEIIRPGDFGFFRLLDLASEIVQGTAGGRRDGDRTLVATWELRAAQQATVKLDLRPTRAENPLTIGFFRNYNCPRTISDR
ncbi:MAG: type VI secretion system membrane subunit TssM [Polyangiaceae bacterium]|nr:type VI secretion system membrane subunit TssM [Polyangiaceae bacterium]